MKVKYQDSLKYKMLERLKALDKNVVLRADFEDLGEYRQISRGFQALIRDKALVKIGQGVYAKAYVSRYINEALIKDGIDNAFREALDRLGTRWEPSSMEQSYNIGRSTQVPVYNIVRLKSRFRRRIGYGSKLLIFEENRNAR